MKTLNCKVQVRHYRFDNQGKLYSYQYEKKQGPICQPQPKGGITYVTLTVGKTMIRERAVCSSRDNFCKKTGRRIALYRALSKLEPLQRETVCPDFDLLEEYVKAVLTGNKVNQSAYDAYLANQKTQYQFVMYQAS